MADPFVTPSTKSTASMFVPHGSFNAPVQKEWRLESAIVNGFYASSWVYSCATIIARHVGKMPFRTWEPNADDEMVVVPNHPAAMLIENPNDRQTRGFQMTFRALHILLGGNCLDKVVTVGRKNEPAELWPLWPDGTYPIPSKRDWLRHYELRGATGAVEDRLDPAKVAHGMMVDPQSPYWGAPPLRAIARPVDMDIKQVRWNAELMDNDAAPSGVFVDPNAHTAKDRLEIKKTLRQHFAGPLNAREPLVLSGGAQWHQLGINPRELDWVLSRKFTVGEICTAYGLLTARFVMDAQTYSNLDAAISYEIENGAIPIAELIGDGLGKVLLTRDDRRRGRKIRPDTSGIPVLRERFHKASESHARFVSSGIPPQTSAAILDLPVGALPGGRRAYRLATLEEITDDPELGDEDL